MFETIVTWLNARISQRDPLWHFPGENSESHLSQLWERAGWLALALQEKGLRAGERVVLVLENSADYVSALLAIWRLGAVAIPVRPYGGRYFVFELYLSCIQERSPFSLVIYDSENEAVDAAQLSFTLEKPLVSLQELRGYSGGDSFAGCYQAKADEHALIQFTSGSTGVPKGVIVTHHMMMKQLQQLRDNHIYHRGGKGMESTASWLPFYHDMGLFIGVLLPLFELANTISAPPAYYLRNPARWFGYMSAGRVDSSFTTNSVMVSTLPFLRRLRPDECSLSSLHLWLAAEKISPYVVDRIIADLSLLGFVPENLHIGYGMAEYALGCTHSSKGLVKSDYFMIDAGGKVSLLDDCHPETLRLVSVGVPNEGCEISIRDEADRPLGENQVGEINVDGPCTTPGYINDAARTREKLVGSRLRTGDLGFIYDGELYYLSRMDDMLVVGGRNVIPSDVELAVEMLPDVGPGRSLLFGIESAENATVQLVLLIESAANLSQTQMAKREEGVRSVVSSIHGLMLNKVVFVAKGTIEKTSSGKKRSQIIKERFMNGQIDMLVGELHEQH